ncbi:MAG: aldehyde dehydrogenase family protein, partial [Limisphaerales bacterium]
MKPALLLVDFQGDHLATFPSRSSADDTVARAAALLAECRERRVPVIHVWTSIDRRSDRRLPHWKKANRWDCVVGTAGHQPPIPLRPFKQETIVHKCGFNCFADGTLDAVLDRIRCDTIILSGVHLHACVRTAAVESLERGFHVLIVGDAVASNDPVHAAATSRWLAGRGVEFLLANEIVVRLDGNPPGQLLHRSPRDTGKVLFEIPAAGTDEVAAATLAAKFAWAKWRETKSSFRRGIIGKAAAQLDAAAPRLARQMAAEIGKPVSHGLEEVRRSAANLRDVIRRSAASEFQTNEPAGIVRHRPLGVMALISPWNNPVAIPAGKIAPALIYGNTVVWKPAPAATKISEVVLKLFREAGVPENAVRLLSGDHMTA